MKNKLRLTSLLLTLAIAALPALRAEDTSSDKPEHKRERGPGGPDNERGPGAMMEQAAKELGLTADQEAKWKTINQQEKTALKALREDTSVAKEDKRAKAREINKGFADQRRAVLTADQVKKFDDRRDKMRERREQGGEHRNKRGKKGDK